MGCVVCNKKLHEENSSGYCKTHQYNNYIHSKCNNGAKGQVNTKAALRGLQRLKELGL
jgi:hypothetical protein